jgi:hypothetical protein
MYSLPQRQKYAVNSDEIGAACDRFGARVTKGEIRAEDSAKGFSPTVVDEISWKLQE